MKRFFLVVLLAIILPACSQVAQITMETTQANLERVKIEKAIAANLKETYCTWDGPKIRELLGDDIKKLPGEVRDQMDALDTLCLSDNLAAWYGKYIRFHIAVILESIKLYAPKVFESIAPFLLL